MGLHIFCFDCCCFATVGIYLGNDIKIYITKFMDFGPFSLFTFWFGILLFQEPKKIILLFLLMDVFRSFFLVIFVYNFLFFLYLVLFSSDFGLHHSHVYIKCFYSSDLYPVIVIGASFYNLPVLLHLFLFPSRVRIAFYI